MGGTSKKRPSPHLHKVPTRSNKVNPRTFQTALVSAVSPMKIPWRFLHRRLNDSTTHGGNRTDLLTTTTNPVKHYRS
jgi:hypothetical protein